MNQLKIIKKPPRYKRLVSLLQNLLLAQHVSGTIMPIIRTSRVIQMVAACGTWRCCGTITK